MAAGAESSLVRLASGGRGAPAAGGAIQLTVNSSPTVVVHQAGEAPELEAEVIKALERHREQLYQELRLELDRRRRAEF